MKWFIRNTLRVAFPRNTKRNYQLHKEDARKFVHARLAHFNAWYQFDYNRVAIRNQKTRWGSCSSKRNLNFNYRILFLPPELQDYLIVHELCHLEEMNHSKNFWALVGQQIPDPKEKARQLREIRGA